jgi:hypothetical protein
MKHLKLFESTESRERDYFVDIVKDAILDIEDEYPIQITTPWRSVHISIEKPNQEKTALGMLKYHRSMTDMWEKVVELIDRIEDKFERVEVTDGVSDIFVKFQYFKISRLSNGWPVIN